MFDFDIGVRKTYYEVCAYDKPENFILRPINKWDIHDLIYARITDYKCFDSLALGKEFFKNFIEFSRVQLYLDNLWSLQKWSKK